MSKKQQYLLYSGFYGVFGYMLYRNIIVAFLIFILVLLYHLMNKKKVLREKRKVYLIQFCDFLHCLSSQFTSHTHFFNGFIEASHLYETLYGNNELGIILQKALTIEKVNGDGISYLVYIKETLLIDDITDFVDSTLIVIKMGNNITKNIATTISLIHQKVQTSQQIEVIVAKKKTEQQLITAIPFIIILLFTLTSSDYLTILYEGVVGRVVMTLAFILFITQQLLGQMITKIEVS